MGGRGASSGWSYDKNGNRLHKYGTEYKSVLEVDNIKFVKANSGQTKSPLETMTKGRIYVTLDSENEPKYITMYDDDNKKYLQIDIKGRPHMINGVPKIPHTHLGYFHDENGTRETTDEEDKLIEKVLKAWYHHSR